MPIKYWLRYTTIYFAITITTTTTTTTTTTKDFLTTPLLYADQVFIEIYYNN